MTTRPTALLLGLLAAVSLAVGPTLPAAAAPEPTARATAHDGVLHRGCHDYVYRYRVKDAGEDWMLELVLRDRTGAGVSSAALFGTQDAKKGKRTFRLCRASTKAGTFTWVGVLTVRQGYTQTVHEVVPSSFRLTRD